MLIWLWVLPVVLAAAFWAARRRKAQLARFADAALLAKMRSPVGGGLNLWRLTCWLAALALTVVGLARPVGDPIEQQVERRGRDVVFVLDVSRSMLAEDLRPNRLERAKLAIADAVQRMQGDRVALVTFAGTSVVKCPLTVDYGFLRLALEDVGVDSVSRGGTLLGDAMRTVLNDVFAGKESKYKDVILITDGGDQESFPVEAASEAGQQGVRLIAIGLGDETEGRRIPITDSRGRRQFVTYQGEDVLTKLDADTLREMVNQTPGGRYLNVSTGAIDLGEVYQKLVAGEQQQLIEAASVTQYEEFFQPFLALALLLLVLERAIPARRRWAR